MLFFLNDAYYWTKICSTKYDVTGAVSNGPSSLGGMVYLIMEAEPAFETSYFFRKLNFKLTVNDTPRQKLLHKSVNFRYRMHDLNKIRTANTPNLTDL
jgi:hypothetical protein